MRTGFEGKSQKDERVLYCFLMILFFYITNLFAQQTNNLQVIWTIPGNPVLYGFGYNMASGDINNDGITDILVSGDTYVQGGGTTPYRGRVYLYYGNNMGDTIPDVVFKSPFVKGTTPTGVRSADLNGDGFDDIIMGEGESNDGLGGVTIFWGGNVVDTIPDILLRGRSVPPIDMFYGQAVSSGDVNGDGYKDLIVGAYGAVIIPGYPYMGRVHIYLGGPNFDTIPDVILNGGHCNDQEGFGSDLGQCADVNNDSYDDIIIGAVNFGACNGRLYIYFGGNPMDTIADVTMIGEGPNHHLGWDAISSLRNANNFDYAMIGTSLWPQGFPVVGNGKIYILFGGNPMDSVPDICMVGRMSSSGLSQSLSRAGYISGSLFDGVISGAAREPGNYIGCTYIWQGEPNLDTIPDAWIRGLQYDEGIGWQVATAGDIDGDGRDEIMVSNYASNYSPKRVWVCKYTGTGIEENYYPPPANRLTLEVYPNPVRSVLRVRVPLSVDRAQIKIFDISGKIVKEIGDCFANARNDNTTQIQVSLRGIPIGIYFVEVQARNNGAIIRETKKIEVVK